MTAKIKNIEDQIQKLLTQKEQLIEEKQNEVIATITHLLPKMDLTLIAPDLIIGALLDIKNHPEKKEEWSKAGEKFRKKWISKNSSRASKAENKTK